MTPPITHVGWFLLCPVLLANVETDCPYLETRRFIPDWWFTANREVVDAFLFITDMMGFDCAYPILITGELSEGERDDNA